jgi:hypothetical protein
VSKLLLVVGHGQDLEGLVVDSGGHAFFAIRASEINGCAKKRQETAYFKYFYHFDISSTAPPLHLPQFLPLLFTSSLIQVLLLRTYLYFTPLHILSLPSFPSSPTNALKKARVLVIKNVSPPPRFGYVPKAVRHFHRTAL